MKKYLKLLLILSLFFTQIKAQEILPFNETSNYLFEKYKSENQINKHKSFKPIFNYSSDSIIKKYYKAFFTEEKLNQKKKSLLWRKLRYEDLVIVKKKDFELRINPLFSFSAKKLSENDSIFWENMRGIELKGKIGKSVYFYTNFLENQSFFQPYVDKYVREKIIVPGLGVPKKYKTNGHDFSIATAYLSFSPSETFNFTLGYGKNFIGNGYRSLLLSDNSCNYPFARFTLNLGKFQFTNILAEFMNFDRDYWGYSSGELAYRKRKIFSANYVSFKPLKNLEIGLYEAIVWRSSDDSTFTNEFDINMLNPVILTRTFQYSLNDKNNILLGLNVSYSPIESTEIYGQFLLDNAQSKNIFNEKFGNKYAYQLGIKYLGTKNPKSFLHGFSARLEYNMAMPYTYGHEIAQQSYSHFNQSIAHPLESNFKESLVFLKYIKKSFSIELRYSKAITSCDTINSHFGNDIFIAENKANFTKENQTIGQGIRTEIEHSSIRFNYLINPTTNFQIFTEFHIRDYKSSLINTSDKFISFGIQTSINNIYRDF